MAQRALRRNDTQREESTSCTLDLICTCIWVQKKNMTMRQIEWITTRELAARLGLSRATLANWRSADLRAGRLGAAPGRPVYRRFGRAVRYAVSAATGEPILAEAPQQGVRG